MMIVLSLAGGGGRATARQEAWWCFECDGRSWFRWEEHQFMKTS
jgi:hypothetical protein